MDRNMPDRRRAGLYWVGFSGSFSSLVRGQAQLRGRILVSTAGSKRLGHPDTQFGRKLTSPRVQPRSIPDTYTSPMLSYISDFFFLFFSLV